MDVLLSFAALHIIVWSIRSAIVRSVASDCIGLISRVLWDFTDIFVYVCTIPVPSKMLSVSQVAGSPAVSLIYTVRNGTVFLNGTAASNLLGRLSAEVVGYFLFYPPLIIAERKLQFSL